MNGHHLDPQVTGDSHMLDLFKTVPLCMHQHWNEKREQIASSFSNETLSKYEKVSPLTLNLAYLRGGG